VLINHITPIQKFSQYLSNLVASNVVLQPKINYVLCLDLLTSYFVIHTTYFEVVQSDCVSEKSEFYYVCRRYLLCCMCRQQLSVCEKIRKVLSQVNRTVTSKISLPYHKVVGQDAKSGLIEIFTVLLLLISVSSQ
jgi:hypothetical protein